MSIRARLTAAVTLVVIALGAYAGASAQLAEKKALTLEAAKKMATAAHAEAVKNNWRMVIAVVDEGGHLLYLERMDETQTGSIRVAIQKARSAAAFKRPTKVFEDAVAGGRNAILGLSGATPIEGGVPIMVDGKLIGAIGASGGTAPQDGQVAKAGVDALVTK
jgi:glc operon protein GlcG